ncbi:hypothetical protein GCK32_018696 [Trichostrongylus colubriformis]|uniref:Uncharacterized protein n=1 Tax=Trichostrongylus colubriformis TaxID=6319 RepID=A0AAN8F2F9_TRICO
MTNNDWKTNTPDIECRKCCDSNMNTLPKKHHISRKHSQFNNTVRLLETKKEEALWKENYMKVAEIEKCLKYYRARERALEELIRERMEAVSRHDYAEAQRAKSLYEETMEHALQDNELERFLSKEEVRL